MQSGDRGREKGLQGELPGTYVRAQERGSNRQGIPDLSSSYHVESRTTSLPRRTYTHRFCLLVDFVWACTAAVVSPAMVEADDGTSPFCPSPVDAKKSREGLATHPPLDRHVDHYDSRDSLDTEHYLRTVVGQNSRTCRFGSRSGSGSGSTFRHVRISAWKGARIYTTYGRTKLFFRICIPCGKVANGHHATTVCCT